MTEPVDQTRLSIAALAAALASAMEEVHPGFKEIFRAKMGDVYNVVREGPMSNIGAMETLKWTQELLKR